MKRILSIALCLFMLVPMLAACGSSDSEDKGAVIQMYLSSDIYNFDPVYSYTDDATTKIMGLLYQGLFEIGESGKVENALCDDYEIVEDAENDIYKMVVTIKETGWSDGRTVSVDDIVYAWKRILDPEFSCPAASLLFNIKNAKEYNNGDVSPDDVGLYAVDSKILEIYFDGPINYNLFIENLASPMLVPLREDVVGKAVHWSTNVAIIVTNGPFTVKAFTPKDKLTLQRNAYYYRTSKQADDKSVNPYKIYVDLSMSSTKQLAAYNDGTVFLDSEIALDSREGWKASAKTEDLMSVHTYYFNTKNPLFAKAEVRRALSLALDRNKMAEIAVFASPATGLITDGVFETTRKNSFRQTGGDLISASANMDEAKNLLKSAGVSSGSFEIMIRDSEVEKALANYARDQWKKLGFTVTVNALKGRKYTTENEYDVYEDQFLTAFTSGEFDVAGIDLQMLSTDAFGTLSQFAVGYSGTAIDLANKEDWDPKPSVTGYISEDYNSLIQLAYEADGDREARSKYLHDAEKLLMTDCPVVPVLFMKNAYVVSKKVSGVEFNYYGGFDFRDTSLKGYEAYTNVDKKN